MMTTVFDMYSESTQIIMFVGVSGDFSGLMYDLMRLS